MPNQGLEAVWRVRPRHADCAALARAARVAPWFAQLLLNREVADAEAARRFLAPAFKELLPPETLPGAEDAALRLAAAVAQQRRIVIYGDYDVDGVTATTILWHCLRIAGAPVEFFIPSRFEEGYGLSAEALAAIAADGPAVVVTVDCGITGIAEARRARELGLELIITDHHQPRADLPDAAIVHPTALADSPNPHLSGAGVALKLAWALARRLCGSERVDGRFRDFLLDATAFAALGLVADIVPLVGENRVIASFGLRHLCHTQNPGLRALIDVAGLSEKARIDDYDVGFLLAPRLNAIGRMGHAREAVELFTIADPGRATEIATTLDELNRRRQAVERRITKHAEQLVHESGFDRDSCRGIVLAHADWHPGVIGIVASRLVDRFHRPAVMIALENGLGQGSGRSVRHFPLHEVLATCDRHLLSHGGHAMAAGIRIEARRVDDFTNAFLAEAAQRLTPENLRPVLELDDELDLAAVQPDAARLLERMAPFGMGNPRPLFATSRVEIVDRPRLVGANGRHLTFTVRQGNTYRRAVAFNQGADCDRLAEQVAVRLAFEPIINRWNGRTRVELRVRAWKPDRPDAGSPPTHAAPLLADRSTNE